MEPVVHEGEGIVHETSLTLPLCTEVPVPSQWNQSCMRGEGVVHETSFTVPLFTEVAMLSQESEMSCIWC